ncbi:hypothetical protein EDB84DRAFT_1553055 [Lactarius hengduanensis]|nr:hypothetical protein EDB84DRAFT_1553055 [Lactarius hengduanensis]
MSELGPPPPEARRSWFFIASLPLLWTQSSVIAVKPTPASGMLAFGNSMEVLGAIKASCPAYLWRGRLPVMIGGIVGR